MCPHALLLQARSPIMLALCLMLSGTCYVQNYAGCTAQLEAYTDIYKTVIFRRIRRIYRQIQRRSKMAGRIQVYSLPMNDVTYT